MRLVLIYNISDSCTYSCEVVLPIEAESAEFAYVSLAEKALEARKGSFCERDFKMFGYDFCSDDFTFRNEEGIFEVGNIQILTIDEWFNQNGQ